MLDCVPAWDGNGTCDCFLAWSWHARDDQRLLIAVNYAGHQSQCYVLNDLMSNASYDRDGSDLGTQGLYLDLPSWGYHVFDASIV